MSDHGTETSQTDPRAGRAADDPNAAGAETAEPAVQDDSEPEGSVQPETGDDENRDSPRRRLCAYTACRAPLPIKNGRGSGRQKYCDDNKSWGSKGLSCKQAALAVENYRSLFGNDQAVEVAIADLGRHVDHIERSLEPIIGLRDAVTNVREHLNGPVAESYAARDAALVQAHEAEERSTAAQDQKDEATSAAMAADQRAGHAVQERDAAVRDRDQAVKAQTQAEARLTDAQTAKKDAEARAEQANNEVNEAHQTITRRTSERDSLHQQIADLRAGIDQERAERQRIQDAHDAAQQQIQSERTEYKQSVEQFHSETRDLRSETRRAMEQVQGLSGEKGRLEQRVDDLLQRIGDTDLLLHSVGNDLAGALAEPGESGEQLTACVERAVPRLRSPASTSTTGSTPS